VIAVSPRWPRLRYPLEHTSLLYERLIFGSRPEVTSRSHKIVEISKWSLAITRTESIGGGVYDGIYNVNPMDDANQIFRAFALSAFSPLPSECW